MSKQDKQIEDAILNMLTGGEYWFWCNNDPAYFEINDIAGMAQGAD